MNNSFQRIGAKSNSQVGRDFENTALNFFKSQDLILKKNIKIDIGIENISKLHAFDLQSKGSVSLDLGEEIENQRNSSD